MGVSMELLLILGFLAVFAICFCNVLALIAFLVSLPRREESEDEDAPRYPRRFDPPSDPGPRAG